EFVFPYADASFDFVFLTSVFTHMLPAEVAQYLREVRRVLRPAGRCPAAFFFLHAGGLRPVGGPRRAVAFPPPADGCWPRAGARAPTGGAVPPAGGGGCAGVRRGGALAPGSRSTAAGGVDAAARGRGRTSRWRIPTAELPNCSRAIRQAINRELDYLQMPT